jgi:hypothetical protein
MPFAGDEKVAPRQEFESSQSGIVGVVADGLVLAQQKPRERFRTSRATRRLLQTEWAVLGSNRRPWD